MDESAMKKGETAVRSPAQQEECMTIKEEAEVAVKDVPAPKPVEAVVTPDRSPCRSARKSTMMAWEDDIASVFCEDRNCLEVSILSDELDGNNTSTLSKQETSLLVRSNDRGGVSYLEAFESGVTLYEDGDYPAAKACFDACLDSFGEDNLNFFMAKEWIGNCEAKMQRIEEAFKQYEIALQGLRNKLGDENEAVARINCVYGDLYSRSGEYDRATEYYEESLRVRKKLFGDGNADAVCLEKKLIRVHEAAGLNATNAKQYQKALTHHQEVLRILKSLRVDSGLDMEGDARTENVLAEVRQLCRIAHSHTKLEQCSAALYYLSDAIELAQHITEDPPLQANVAATRRDYVAKIHLLSGYVLERMERSHLAVEQYALALPIMEEIYGKESESVGKLLNRKAFNEAKAGEDDQAKSTLESAVKILAQSVSIENYETYMSALDAKAKLHAKSNEFERVLVCWSEKLDKTMDFFGEDSKMMAETLHQFGIFLSSLGEHKHALGFYKQALEIKSKCYSHGDRELNATLQALATSYEAVGCPKEALKRYREMLDSVDTALRPTLLNAIGSIYSRQAKLDEAAECFKESLFLHDSTSLDERSKATTLVNLGNVHALRKQFGDALWCYDEALRLQSTRSPCEEDDNTRIRAFHNKGLLCFAHGSYDDAEACFGEALDMAGDGAKMSIASVLNSMANIYFTQGNFADAIEFYKRSLEMQNGLNDLNHSQKVGILCNLGTSYSQTGELSKATKYLERALDEVTYLGQSERKTTFAMAKIRHKLGAVHAKKGDVDAAREQYSIALRTFRSVDEDHTAVLRCRHDLGLLLVKSGTGGSKRRKSGASFGDTGDEDRLNAGMKILEDICEKMKSRKTDVLAAAKISIDLAGAHYVKGNLLQSKQLCDAALENLNRSHVPDSHPCFVQLRRWLSKIERVTVSP